jgi:MOSC domain-containing protein YiiM
MLRFGGVIAQVTQPRQPCFKLGLRFEDPQMVRAFLGSGRSGWYLRVLEPGHIEAGAPITRIDHPNPSWSVARLNRLLGSHATVEEMTELAELPGLGSGIRESARAALEAATVTNAGKLPARESD